MKLWYLGPLFGASPDEGLKNKGHETGWHIHKDEDHITVLWKKHRVIIERPILGAKEVLWQEYHNEVHAGNGVDSFVQVPAGHRHNVITLEHGAFHVCLFLHTDAVGRTMKEWQGFKKALL